MAFRKDQDEIFGKNWDPEKMLRLYIYSYLKKKNMYEVAEVFAQEANLEMFELVESDEGMLAEWWELFWPTFCSRASSKEGGVDAASCKMPSEVTGLGMLVGLNDQGAGSSQQAAMGNAQQSALPVIPMIYNQLAGNDFYSIQETQPANLLPTTGTSQHSAGKAPINAEYDDILGQSAARFAYERSSFHPVSLSSQTPCTMAPAGNPSQVRLPASSESNVQVSRDPTNDVAVGSSNEMDSTRPGVNSTSAAATASTS